MSMHVYMCMRVYVCICICVHMQIYVCVYTAVCVKGKNWLTRTFDNRWESWALHLEEKTFPELLVRQIKMSTASQLSIHLSASRLLTLGKKCGASGKWHQSSAKVCVLVRTTLVNKYRLMFYIDHKSHRQ